MAKARKSVEELYRAIFAIRDALQDAQQLAAEAAVMSDAFGGEIARVITAQINTYFIPGISKFIDDAETPGAMSPLITFLDSVPLAMTRGEPEPQQVTPAPVANAQLAEPTGVAQPAAGSFAAKTKESKTRENKEDAETSHAYFMHNRRGSALSRRNPYKLGQPDMTAKEYEDYHKQQAALKKGATAHKKTTAEVTAKHEFLKGLLTPKQAVQALYDDGYNMERAKQLVKQWQAEDEALYESRSMKECYQIIRKGKKDEQVVATVAEKEEADCRAKTLNGTITPTEKDFFGTEYIVRAFKKPEGQKDVSQTKALPTPKKMPEAYVADRSAIEFNDPFEGGLRKVSFRYSPKRDEYISPLVPEGYVDPILDALRAKGREATCSHEQYAGDHGWLCRIILASEPGAGYNESKEMAESSENRGMTAGEIAAAESEERKVSRDPNFDPKYSAEKKKESLSLKDIPIDDYSVQDAYDELMQGGEVEDDLAPDYIAQNMFGAEPGSPRYQQVADKLAGMKKAPAVTESLEMGDLGGPDLSLMASKVQGLIEDGFSQDDALDYIADTEEVDRDQLKDACGLQ